MSDPEFDNNKPSLSKDDWTKKFIEQIQNPLYYEKTKPSLLTSNEPELWETYRMKLSEYLKHSMDIDTNPYSFYKNKRKKSRNMRFARNLLAATRQLNDFKYKFFERAKFPMSIITDKNIQPIINEFKTIMNI
ncbi:34715_t:CDS:2 [Gigaspora margarita]|uniref:34715_t:CDS:1 n=1 Tax=Gigaspora margarita TaxID=4874 RepID=A0ABN7UQ09_GIGMA|nr:34715_t:CDS:2 [Gigaspora margarita]